MQTVAKTAVFVQFMTRAEEAEKKVQELRSDVSMFLVYLNKV